MSKKTAPANIIEESDFDLSDRAIAKRLGVPTWAVKLLRERLERTGSRSSGRGGKRSGNRYSTD